MLVIDNAETQDDYTAALTLESPFGGRLVYVVANQSARVQFKPIPDAPHGQLADWQPPEGLLLTPQSSFIDKIAGARFRTAITGSPARIIAQLSEPGDILPASGTPFTSTLSGSGGVGGVGALVSRTTIAADVAFNNAGQVLITAPAFTADGITVYEIEVFSPAVLTRSDSQFSDIYLRDGGVQLGRLARFQTSVSAVDSEAPMFARVRLTPAAGAHTYDLFGIRGAAAAAQFRAGAGGVGVAFQAYLMISTV